MREILNLLTRPIVINGLRIVGALAIVAILIGPQVAAVTSVRVNFSRCVPTMSRRLIGKPGETITFKVTSIVDNTLLVENAKIKRDLKANKSAFITVTLPKEAGWYNFRLATCDYEAHMAVLEPNGELPDKSKQRDGTMMYGVENEYGGGRGNGTKPESNEDNAGHDSGGMRH